MTEPRGFFGRRMEFVPLFPAGASGLDLLRFARADLRSPEFPSGACVSSPLGVGAAVGDPIAASEDPVVSPASGEAAFYLLAHRLGGGSRPSGTARIAGVRMPRLATGACP